MIELVVFDLDGTLADTLEDLATAVNHALSSLGLDGYPVNDYRNFVGNGVDNLVKRTLADNYSEENAALVKQRFKDYYTEHSEDFTKPYDGISELLSKLKADGVKTAVISNKPDVFVPVILKDLYPEHSFDQAWGEKKEFPRKPSPESLEAMIKLMNADKQSVIYVGDSNVDVDFAKAAGVRVCGVEWGFRGREELEKAGADHIVSNADELYELIRTL